MYNLTWICFFVHYCLNNVFIFVNGVSSLLVLPFRVFLTLSLVILGLCHSVLRLCLHRSVKIFFECLLFKSFSFGLHTSLKVKWFFFSVRNVSLKYSESLFFSLKILIHSQVGWLLTGKVLILPSKHLLSGFFVNSFLHFSFHYTFLVGKWFPK